MKSRYQAFYASCLFTGLEFFFLVAHFEPHLWWAFDSSPVNLDGWVAYCYGIHIFHPHHNVLHTTGEATASVKLVSQVWDKLGADGITELLLELA